MKIKFTGKISDIKLLQDLGYIDNHWGNVDDPIEIVDGIFEASKAFPSKTSKSGVNVAITYGRGVHTIDVYKYRGAPTAHKRISLARNPKQYIQDLIDNKLAVIE